MFTVFPGTNLRIVAVAGLITLIVLMLQMLIGYRKIKFQGRTHLKVHKTVGWIILTVGLIHAALAFLLFR